MLLGTSKKLYPKNSTPAPNPNCVAVNPVSRFIVNAANPTLLRSM